MSKFEIKMPKLGESITEGTITTWSVKVGDAIQEDDVLFEVETVKVSAEIPSPVAGTILEILYQEGDTVSVGTVVAIIEIEGDDEPAASSAPAEVKEEKVEAPAPKPEEAVVAPTPTQAAPAPQTNVDKEDPSKWQSPVVIELIKNNNLSAENVNLIQGTGYLGRLTKNDILKFIAQKDSKGTTSTAAPKQANEQPKSAPQEKLVTDTKNNTIVEMNTIRRVTAERMVMSRKTSAHVTTVIEVDVTKLVNWRNKNKKQFAEHEGISLTYMPAITEATAKALIKYPQVNASVDGNNIILKKDINIGVAVALDGWNLIVPVIHGADKLNISGLAHAIDTKANRARNNKLKIDDIEGGTFTITNFGSFKNIFGTPIINQPEVAILGVGFIEKKPSVIETPEGDVIAIRHKMYLSLSYDHRVIDGALGGAFLLHIANTLEGWS